MVCIYNQSCLDDARPGDAPPQVLAGWPGRPGWWAAGVLLVCWLVCWLTSQVCHRQGDFLWLQAVAGCDKDHGGTWQDIVVVPAAAVPRLVAGKRR